MSTLDHLAELLAKATPTGWLAPFGAYSPSSVLPIYASGNRQVAESVSREDAALIIAAINALPALLEIARAAQVVSSQRNGMYLMADMDQTLAAESALRRALAKLPKETT